VSSTKIPRIDLLENCFERLPEPIYIWQRAGNHFKLIDCNDAARRFEAAQLFPTAPGSNSGRLGKKHRGFANTLVDCALANEQQALTLESSDRGQATQRSLQLRFFPISSDAVAVLLRDDTQTARIERGLRRRIDGINLALHSTNDGIWEEDFQTGTVSLYPRWYEILGYDGSEEDAPTLKSFDDLVHPEDKQHAMRGLEAHLKDRVPLNETFRVRHRSGRYIWVRRRGQATWDEAGKPIRFAGAISDITAFKETEIALRKSDERHRALLQATPDITLRLDRAGRHLDIHYPEGSSVTGAVKPDQIVGLSVREVFDEEQAVKHDYHRLRALDTGQLQTWEYSTLIDGKERFWEARFARADEDEVLVTVRDVSERFALEQESLAATERERARIGQDLHDSLGQVLTGVSLSLKDLTRGLGEERSVYQETAQQLCEMVQDTIRQTRRVSHRLSPWTSPSVDLESALKALAKEFGDRPELRCTLSCSVDHPPHDPDVEIQLYRIAQQSINNAITHGGARNIELRYSCDGQRTILEVVDDGTGLPPGDAIVEGMGLKSMRYRSRIIHGHIVFAPRKRGGTRVQCSCPCQLP